jgi:MOSC domain-containing protein YiiM
VTRQGKIVAINISAAKGTRKKNVGRCSLITEFGLKEDAHAGDWHRQVSLLAQESIDKMVKLGLKVGPGDFAENITTQGVDLLALPIGTRFRLGGNSLLEVTQIGKVCHTRCAIFYQAGDCVMPKEGIFARVLEGGEIKVGDEIDVLGGDSDPQR